MAKKMTNSVREVVDGINLFLFNNKVKDIGDTLFLFGQSYLEKKDMYQGYHFFKYTNEVFDPFTGKTRPLAKKMLVPSTQAEADCVQLNCE